MRRGPIADYRFHPLNAVPAARTNLVALDSRRQAGVPDVIVHFARRDGAHVIVYDASTSSLWTTPCAEDDERKRFSDRALSAAQLRHLGQHTSARVVDTLIGAGSGPVPYVVEHFLLKDEHGCTELEYGGELGTDLWFVGELWGQLVASRWEKAVRASLEAVRLESERRAAPREPVSQG